MIQWLRKSWNWIAGLFVFLVGAYLVVQRKKALARAHNAETAEIKLHEAEKEGYVAKAARAAEDAKGEIAKAERVGARVKEKINVLEAKQSDGLAGRLNSWNSKL